MGNAMKNESKNVKSVKSEGLRSLLLSGAIRDDSEAVKKREEEERSIMRSCLLNTILLKKEPVLRKIWMSLASIFAQTFLKSLTWCKSMRGRNAEKLLSL